MNTGLCHLRAVEDKDGGVGSEDELESGVAATEDLSGDATERKLAGRFREFKRQDLARPASLERIQE
ncbi:MAG: hypothetical protein QOF48_433 [Verrucomicrobiota bacterium]|jgi:hypothetical protein